MRGDLDGTRVVPPGAEVGAPERPVEEVPVGSEARDAAADQQPLEEPLEVDSTSDRRVC